MNNSGKTLLALLSGALAGAAAGLLLAPDKGTEVRRKITDKTKDLCKDFNESWEIGVQKIKEYANTAQAEADDLQNSVNTKTGKNKI